MKKRLQMQKRNKQKPGDIAVVTPDGGGGVYIENRQFDIGKTLNISDGIREKRVNWLPLLARHARKDWGDNVPDEDRAANDVDCLDYGCGVYSWYDSPQGRVMIVSYVGKVTRVLMFDEWWS